MTSALHEERLDTVVRHLLRSGASSVLDLGCGPGELLLRLVQQPQFTRIIGIDIDEHVLSEARLVLGLGLPGRADRMQVRYGSFETAEREFKGFEAAALVETIEHIDPRRLSRVESAVFGDMRPATVLVTTPNQEYNILHDICLLYTSPSPRTRHDLVCRLLLEKNKRSISRKRDRRAVCAHSTNAVSYTHIQ